MFDNQKQGWVTNFFRQRKITIAADAVEYILDMVENNTRDMRAECERLALFFGPDATIGLESVEQYIYHSKEENVFTLFDRICERELAARGGGARQDPPLAGGGRHAAGGGSPAAVPQAGGPQADARGELREPRRPSPSCASSARRTRRPTSRAAGSSAAADIETHRAAPGGVRRALPVRQDRAARAPSSPPGVLYRSESRARSMAAVSLGRRPSSGGPPRVAPMIASTDPNTSIRRLLRI